MRTWHYEIGVVTAIVFASAEATGGTWPNRVTALALVFTFAHAQIADRMAEQQERSADQIECWRKAAYFWVTKEALWITVFALTKLWTAIIGAVVFLLYPVWRKWYRKRRPFGREENSDALP